MQGFFSVKPELLPSDTSVWSISVLLFKELGSITFPVCLDFESPDCFSILASLASIAEGL